MILFIDNCSQQVDFSVIHQQLTIIHNCVRTEGLFSGIHSAGVSRVFKHLYQCCDTQVRVQSKIIMSYLKNFTESQLLPSILLNEEEAQYLLKSLEKNVVSHSLTSNSLLSDLPVMLKIPQNRQLLCSCDLIEILIDMLNENPTVVESFLQTISLFCTEPASITKLRSSGKLQQVFEKLKQWEDIEAHLSSLLSRNECIQGNILYVSISEGIFYIIKPVH